MKSLLATLFLLLCLPARATVWTSTNGGPVDASYGQVNGAVTTLAHDGDTVVVPSGTATWSSTLSINNAITLQGSGTNSTIISGNNLISIAHSGVRVTNMRLNGTFNPPDINGYWVIFPHNNINGFRIDNCFIYGGGRSIYCGGLGGSGYAWGVIDHNYFLDNNVAVGMHGGNCLGWTFAQVPGSTNSVVFEDNKIVRTSASNPFTSAYAGEDFYHQWGAHSIIRHNVIDNTGSTSVGDFVDAHGNTHYMDVNNSTDCGNYEAGTVICEAYANTWMGNSGMNELLNLRGGCMIWYSNTFTMNSDPGFPFMRLMEEEGWKDSNFVPLSTSWPGEQGTTNSFFWNNTYNGSPTLPSVEDGFGGVPQVTFIREGRDYWNHKPLSTNIFYNASYPEGYKPLVYPHPLVSGGGGPTTPVTQVTPSSLAWTMNPGSGSSNKTFTVKNNGGGTLVGNVRFANP